MADSTTNKPVAATPTPGDLTVKVIGRRELGSVPRKSVDIRVCKAKLIEHSMYFEKMLSGNWAEGKSETITLLDDNIKGMEVWFRAFHNTLSALPNSSISILDIWHIIEESDKYDLKREHLQKWFMNWVYEMIQKSEYPEDRIKLSRQLLFPTYSFNYAAGFQNLTKYLVYNYKSHISEINPGALSKMHLPSRVIQQLNAARGRLRTILHKRLFSRVAVTLERASCTCKEHTIFAYLRELQRIGVWPLEDSLSKYSIQQVLDRIPNFDENKLPVSSAVSVPGASTPGSSSPPVSKPKCIYCDDCWGVNVRHAASYAAKYFHGLCMDCMTTTKDIRLERGMEYDYWHHNEKFEAWDRGCRIKHGEATWYFSFMGRREKLGQFDQPAEATDEGGVLKG
ncbi:hypothetical protein FQN54_002335 [Arachnomyces sp. PD_36]|nr:hypothetical protein FQN54_002335 [Arachnomyces sp. PD_36]